MAKFKYVCCFKEVGRKDVASVGGKNASLGEMIKHLARKGINVPPGFATTADAYWDFIDANDLRSRIKKILTDLDKKKISLKKASQTIRQLFAKAKFSADFENAVTQAYHKLRKECGNASSLSFAVRSSATAEDLPDSSFAGQHETYLNVRGEKELLKAIKRCFSSLFTERAITYRKDKGYDHFKIALSAGIQMMVRSDKASSGVIFTLDTDTGFPDVVLITGAWGLGETVVGGKVDPDEFLVFKPLLGKKNKKPMIRKSCGAKKIKAVYKGKQSIQIKNTLKKERTELVLSDDEILTLAKWAAKIEKHYGMPMDIEWAKDALSRKLYIVQARPETVQSQKKRAELTIYQLKEKSKPLVKGLAIGNEIAAGEVCVIKSPKEENKFKDGAILVTEMTDPDWGPILNRASGIITNRGGRTAHAAIVSRELGIPAVVGTDNATEVLKTGQKITLSCAEGSDGVVYKGILKFKEKKVKLEDVPKIKTPIMLNMADPTAAFSWYQLPCQGIGLARIEFVIGNVIQVHPLALLDDSKVSKDARKKIAELTVGYKDKGQYFIDKLAEGVAQLAASQYPKPVIVRMSDFKTNEYAHLIGGSGFEPEEKNPMLGFRGASRYYSKSYRPGFALECKAIRKAREEMGLDNIIVMIPFCRTVKEADQVLKVMQQEGLKRGKNKLQVYVMAEIPSNVILASDFAKRFDGFSIGSNDLTQLVLGVDRDSADLAHLFDERNQAVKDSIADLVKKAHAKKCRVSICGQAPSDYPDFAEFLVKAGIDSISLTPDSVLGTIQHLAKVTS